MELKDYLTIIIPSFVTLLSFWVSFRINKKEHLQSMQKFKLEKQLSDLWDTQQDVLNYVDMLCNFIAFPDKKPEGYDELENRISTTIICFGSEDAVKLIAYIRHMIYTAQDDKIEMPTRDLIAAYVLLAMQIKYDTTGIKTSPNVWYIGKYTTQKMLNLSNFYYDSIKTINTIVEELNLESFLKIVL